MINTPASEKAVQKKGLERELGRILKESDIHTVFQPIISLRDGSLLGYEALSRGPDGGPLNCPDALFGVAGDCGKLWELDQLCLTRALETALREQLLALLFLNVNPAVDDTFLNGSTHEYLGGLSMDPCRVVFEISEKNAVRDMKSFTRTIEYYKRLNYKIAIDDAGAGYSGLNMITDVHPHYIKLDMKLVRDIDSDLFRKALVKSLYDFANLTGTFLIAEGIETEAELRTLIGIGVHYGQGFLIQRPEPEVRGIRPEVLEQVRTGNRQREYLCFNVTNCFIGYLCADGATVGPEEPAGRAESLLCDGGLPGVVVVASGGEVVGTVTRRELGGAPDGRRPVRDVMERAPLTVEYTTPVDIAVRRAFARPDAAVYDPIVVTQSGFYRGVATIRGILERIIEMEVNL